MWSKGIIACPATGEKYEYYVKHYDSGSQYGIDGGKVSKMCIRKLGGSTDLYSYDRGLDADELDAEGRKVYEHILEMYK